MKQAMKRAEKDRVTRIEQDRRARERQFMLGDRYSVMASRADYADASSDPDARQWVDLVFHEIMQRPLPDQYELRRDVWRVHEIGSASCRERMFQYVSIQVVAVSLTNKHVK